MGAAHFKTSFLPHTPPVTPYFLLSTALCGVLMGGQSLFVGGTLVASRLPLSTPATAQPFGIDQSDKLEAGPFVPFNMKICGF